MCSGQNMLRRTEILTWERENPDEGSEGTQIHLTNIRMNSLELLVLKRAVILVGPENSHNSRVVNP
jgi:hypothetical protein